VSYCDRVAAIHRELGIARDYRTWLPLHCEPAELVSIGADIYGRIQQLAPQAAELWRDMRAAAERDGIELLVVSAFRSVARKRMIIERKLAAGQELAQILKVNAAPGYSEHHSGRALDLTAPGTEPLSEAFEQTLAFAWLMRNAPRFRFRLSYPRDNPYGVIYEPWHWAAEGK
jgi:D-alanyl-D-alanine carboxypeptidase